MLMKRITVNRNSGNVILSDPVAPGNERGHENGPGGCQVQTGHHLSLFFMSSFFIGPRYTWGPIYGSECLSLTTRPF